MSPSSPNSVSFIEHTCCLERYELCLSFEKYLQWLLGKLGKLCSDDDDDERLFPVSGLSCTHRSLLHLCQLVAK